MQKTPIITLLCLLSFSFLFANNNLPSNLTLMPVPAQVQVVDGQFRLDAKFSVAVNAPEGERLARYATRVLRRLSGRTGLFFPQDYIYANSTNDTANFVITVNRPGKLVVNENESYQLTVSPAKIELRAETDFGAMRGLETFLQLLQADANGYFLPAVKIADAPRFIWRGLMIDVSRHFMPVEVIKRNLDGMAAVKLNVLHWHLVDDQGFRVECHSWPNLYQKSSDGLYYTQTQIKEIIAYAADRGIRVVPEFDVPAHASAWIFAYPQLTSGTTPTKVERNWGVFNSTINPTQEFTYKFMDKFFKEMAGLFEDEYIHIGGDENSGKDWKANPEIQAFMQKNKLKNNHELQLYFNERILKILTKHGKKMIGWDEIFQPDLPQDVVVHAWRGYKYLKSAAEQGHLSILSNGYYIDLIQSAGFHYLNDPIPPDSNLSTTAQKCILGGEATSWAELVTYETIDSRIWPRTIAIAERFWSPQSVRDVDDMYRRMEVVSLQMEELELTHLKNYDMLLRRLTHNQDITALKTFADIVEPVKIYNRHFQGKKYTSYSPYTRLVDAARPESMTARRFNKLVACYLETNDEQAKSELVSMLETWQANHEKLMPVINNSPVLQEIAGLSKTSASLAQTGLQAVNFLQTDQKPEAEWSTAADETVKAARQPAGQVELMIAPAVEKLILAAKNQ